MLLSSSLQVLPCAWSSSALGYEMLYQKLWIQSTAFPDRCQRFSGPFVKFLLKKENAKCGKSMAICKRTLTGTAPLWYTVYINS